MRRKSACTLGAAHRHLSFAVATQPVEVHAAKVPLALTLSLRTMRILACRLPFKFALCCNSSASDDSTIALRYKSRARDLRCMRDLRCTARHKQRVTRHASTMCRRSTCTSAAPMSRLCCASTKQEWSPGTSRCMRCSCGTTTLMPCFSCKLRSMRMTSCVDSWGEVARPELQRSVSAM